MVMMLSNTIDTKTKDQYGQICKLVDISMLSTFIRNFPLNNLSEEERKRITDFENYIVGLEDKLFLELGVF